MKVKSVLFSEMRNKLGNQIVGTGWKGRMVFRAYKIPANPNTLKQQAHRDHHDKVLKLYQANVGGVPAKEAMWNTDALPRSISGYNLFQKLGRSSRIAVPTTVPHPTHITCTYTVPTDISTAALFVRLPDGSTWVELLGPGFVVPGVDQTTEYDHTTDGVHEFFVVDARSKTYPPTNADDEGVHNNWDVDEINGVAKVAQCIATGNP